MFSGSRRAAIGSILLRSPGSSNPLQYSFKGACRSLCPAAIARPSIYAAKRLSCGPGAERRDPTKQLYSKMLFYDPVVLAVMKKIATCDAPQGCQRRCQGKITATISLCGLKFRRALAQ